MNNQNILICGGGIAGLTLGFWLQKYGFQPVVVEIAPSMRTGGYMLDFWGVGYIVAERMDILDMLKAEQERYKMQELDFVNRHNRKVGGLKTSKLREMTGYR